MINSLCLNFEKKSPYAFTYGTNEYQIKEKIANKKVFIDSGEMFIWLHSMVYYLMNAEAVFITEDICNEEDVWCAKQMLEIISEVYYDYDVLYDKFISIGKEIFDDFVNGFSEITKDGLIYVERSISIPDIFGHTNDLKNQYINKLNKEYRGNVGFCWSYQNQL